MDKQDIRQFSQKELRLFFIENNFPKYRANQVYEWIWKHYQLDFDLMTNLPIDLRELLKKRFVFNQISILHKSISIDRTTKFLFQIGQNKVVEGVLIPQLSRLTACISSQIGCSLACDFCATGKLKLDRNLTVGEIFDQVFLINQYAINKFKKPITNIVYMGMGEPLLNIKNVLKSTEHIISTSGLGMSAKRITVSSSGIIKMIRKIADMQTKFNLAISLHSAIDSKRSQIMEINKTNSLKELLTALEYFYHKTNIRPTYEYVLLRGVNDSIEDAKELIKFCSKIPSKVNLIEYNKVEGLLYEKSTTKDTNRFITLLEKNNVIVKLRKSRGEDINAACGQLATQQIK